MTVVDNLTIVPINLRCELQQAPLWIDIPNPRFSWSFSRNLSPSWRQEAYQIEVTSKEGLCWDSGEVYGKESFSITYQGEDFNPFSLYQWRVRVKGNTGGWSKWSESASFETAML